MKESGCPEFRAALERRLGREIPPLSQVVEAWGKHPITMSPSKVAIVDDWDSVHGSSEMVTKPAVGFLKKSHVSYTNMAQSEAAPIDLDRVLDVAVFNCRHGMEKPIQVACIRDVKGMHVQKGRHTTAFFVLTYGFGIKLPANYIEMRSVAQAKRVSLNDNSSASHRQQGSVEHAATSTKCILLDADMGQKGGVDELRRKFIAPHSADDGPKRNLIVTVMARWEVLEPVAGELGLSPVTLECPIIRDGSKVQGVTCRTLAGFFGPMTSLRAVPATMKWDEFKRMFYLNGVPFFNAYVRHVKYLAAEARAYLEENKTGEVAEDAETYLEASRSMIGQNVMQALGSVAYQDLYDVHGDVDMPERLVIDRTTLEVKGRMFATAAAKWLVLSGASNSGRVKPVFMKGVFAGMVMKLSRDRVTAERGRSIVAECKAHLLSKEENELDAILRSGSKLGWVSNAKVVGQRAA